MSILDNVKDITSIVQQIDNIELYKRILDLQKEVTELYEQNILLKQQNKEVKKYLELKDSLVFENNMYWIKSEQNQDGPFCSKCWDDNNKLVRLHSQGKDYICRVCNTYIDTDPNDYDPVIRDSYSW